MTADSLADDNWEDPTWGWY